MDSTVHTGKKVDNFPIQNGLQQSDALLPLIFNFALEYATRGGPGKSGCFDN
jgi:hypothetical protein